MDSERSRMETGTVCKRKCLDFSFRPDRKINFFYFILHVYNQTQIQTDITFLAGCSLSWLRLCFFYFNFFFLKKLAPCRDLNWSPNHNVNLLSSDHGRFEIFFNLPLKSRNDPKPLLETNRRKSIS